MANLETLMSMEANNPLGGYFPMYFTFRLLICICIFSLADYPLVKVIHLSSYKFTLARFTLFLIWEWKRKFRTNESVSTIRKFVPWDLCYFCHKSELSYAVTLYYCHMLTKTSYHTKNRFFTLLILFNDFCFLYNTF